MKKIVRKWSVLFILFAQTAVLSAVTLLCVLPMSCKLSEEGIVFVGGDFVSPILEEVEVLDEKNVLVRFSEKVKLKNYVVSSQVKDISDSSEHSLTLELSPALKAAGGGYGKVEADYSLSEDGHAITYSAKENFVVGQAYEIFGTVEDRAGNTLTFCVPFSGFNCCLPELIMTELQVKYKKQKEDSCRCEFVEFLALSDGNLSGLELVNAADGEGKKYVFPAEEVKAGEIFIVHLRSAGSGCVTETDDLNASTAPHSGKNVRDIWSENTKARLNDNSDIVVLRNSVDGSILDAFMYASEDTVEWGKNMTSLAEEVLGSGIYESIEVTDVEVNSGLGSVAAKSFCRSDAKDIRAKVLAEEEIEYPVKRKADNWVIKTATPGTL